MFILSVEWGSVADWVSGVATFISAIVAYMISIRKPKVNLLTGLDYRKNEKYILTITNETYRYVDLIVSDMKNVEIKDFNGIIRLEPISDRLYKVELELDFCGNNKAKVIFFDPISERKIKIRFKRKNNNWVIGEKLVSKFL
ncbi:hypothetical protein SY111_16300 [Ligilactobacillus agilis]|uniref:Uncharacterized protein n=1 Tax=Ligilactobacillus agilis TaxID=1601 RepID=A0A6F9XUT4_9LACO|nr:hypothetical protein [Ligilactobacillus agilis]GET09006.1 hypothetical protein SY111_16300 [Ligilactobacillus agilis]